LRELFAHDVGLDEGVLLFVLLNDNFDLLLQGGKLLPLAGNLVFQVLGLDLIVDF
jgi:hypothetical protein